MTVEDRRGRRPSAGARRRSRSSGSGRASSATRSGIEALRKLTEQIAEAWVRRRSTPGHPMEVGHRFLECVLPGLTSRFNRSERAGAEPVPWLAALVCASAFDLALHDAYGVLHGVPTYETYNAQYMNLDLVAISSRRPPGTRHVSFAGRLSPRSSWSVPGPESIPAWHLVGGKDPVDPWELTGSEPDDGYPCCCATGSAATA